MKKHKILNKALKQSSPKKSIEKIAGLLDLYIEACEKIYVFLAEQEPGMSGTFITKVEIYDFNIDYRVFENMSVDLWCAELYKDGEKVYKNWLDWGFEDAIPKFSLPDEEWPGIQNYGEFL